MDLEERLRRIRIKHGSKEEDEDEKKKKNGIVTADTSQDPLENRLNAVVEKHKQLAAQESERKRKEPPKPPVEEEKKESFKDKIDNALTATADFLVGNASERKKLLEMQPIEPGSIKNTGKVKTDQLDLGNRNNAPSAKLQTSKQQIVDQGKQGLLDAEKHRQGSIAQFEAGFGDVLSLSGSAANWIGLDGVGTRLATEGAFIQKAADPVQLEEVGFDVLFNPKFYTHTMVRQLPFTLALLPASIIGGYAGAGAAGAIGLGFLGKTILGAIGAATLSRPMEGALEAASVFDQMRAKGKSIDEANKAANKTFMLNTSLASLDAVEFAAAFSPFKGGNRLIKTVKRGVGMAGGQVLEGAEEVAQNAISTTAQGEEFDIRSPENQEAFAGGFIQGTGLSVSGAIFGRVRDDVLQKTPGADEVLKKYIDQGLPLDEAKLRAADEIGERNPDAVAKIVEESLVSAYPEAANIIEENKPKEKVFDYQSTQLNLPEQTAQSVKTFADQIPTEELSIDTETGEGGVETQPHITVLYGIDNKTQENKVAELLQGVPPIEVELGNVSIFENDTQDILKVEVKSDQLAQVNEVLSKNLDTPGQTFDTYTPHVTIAYLKKGEGAKYVGNNSFAGQKLTLNSLAFSKNTGEQVEIPLGNGEVTQQDASSVTPPAKKELVTPEQISPAGRIKTVEVDNVYAKIPDGVTEPKGMITKKGDKLFPTDKFTPEIRERSGIELDSDGSIKEGFLYNRITFTEDVALQGLDDFTGEFKDDATVTVGEFTYKKSTIIDESLRDIETRFGEYIGNNLEAVKAEYKKRFGNVLSADNVRELSEDYAKDRDSKALLAAAVHEPSSELVNLMYADALAATDPDGKLLFSFTAGGPGSGKTTATGEIDTLKELLDTSQVVYDTTLQGFESGAKKIQAALDAGKEVMIVYVHRDVVEAFESGVIPRAIRDGRTVPYQYHIDAHIAAPQSIVKLQERFGDNENFVIEVVDNSRGKGEQVESDLDLLTNLGYNKQAVSNEIAELIESKYRNGELPESIYKGLKGTATQTESKDNRQSNGKSTTQGNERSTSESTTTQINTKFDKSTGTNVVVEKRRVLTTKESSSIKTSMIEKLQEARVKGKTATEYTDLVKQAVVESIALAKNDKVALSGIRTAVNNQMFEIAGATGDTYQNNYKTLQIAKEDPDLGQVLNFLEETKGDLDEQLVTAREVPAVVEKTTREVVVKKSTITSQTPVGTGRAKESRFYKRLRSLIEENAQNDVNYNPLDLDRDTQNAVDLIEKNPKRAYLIAKGLVDPPEGMTSAKVALGLAEAARMRGDHALFSDVATSLSLRSTRYGQELVSLRGQITENSAAYFMKQLIDARLEKIGKLYGNVEIDTTQDAGDNQVQGNKKSNKAKAMAKIKLETRKLKEQMKREQEKVRLTTDIQSFIDEITC